MREIGERIRQLSSSPSSHRPDVAALAAALAVGTALAAVVWLAAPELGFGYSPVVGFRAQTEALLDGRLALRDYPDRLPQDWAWGAGVQQVWGLGVPLLRLPFEVAARAAGSPGFPDRVVLFLAFVAAGALYFRGLRRARPADSPLLAGVATALAICLPALLPLLRYRFAAYEEAIVYGCLYAYGLAGLLLAWSARPTALGLQLLLLAAGLAPLVRPTALAYAVPIAVLALVQGVRRGLRRGTLALGLALALVGPAALLATNQLRFGAPLEFGHRLNVTRLPPLDLATRFDYPYATEPVGSAVAELVGSLFLVEKRNGIDFLARDLHPFQSPTARFREFYLSGYGAVELALLGLGWAAALWSLRRRRGAGAPAPLDAQAPAALGAVSVAGFAALALFYLRSPWITSRYLLDFGPAIAFAGAAALLALGTAVERRPRGRQTAACALAALLFGVWFGGRATGFASQRLPYYKALPSVTAEVARERLDAALARTASGPPPRGYLCRTPATAGLQIVGWKLDEDCSVDVSSSFFLARDACLRLWVEGPLSARVPRVLRGLTPLERTSQSSVGPGRTGLTFCAPAPAGPGVELYSIAWVDPRQLALPPPPLRLLGAAIGSAAEAAAAQ